MTEYEVQANEFLKKAGARMTISRMGEAQGFPFDKHDKNWHYKYQVTLTRNRMQYRFMFYDSHMNWIKNNRPSRYDVLACVEKYCPDYFEAFVSEYGYDIDEPGDYKRVRKIYEACRKQYERLYELFGDELMDELREIN